MKDIAGLLGLSETTVSHVLRGRDEEFRIASQTARRVRETAERLGYRPSALARNFKHHKAYSLALAVGDLGNPFWAALALGAQRESDRHGYTLVFSHTAESIEKERQVVELLRDRRVDGLILSPAHLEPRHLAPLQKEGLPFVLVDRTIAGLNVPSVVTDSIGGMQLAVDHLVQCGHRRIAYLGGPTHISTFRERLEGYRGAMGRHGLRPGPYGESLSDPEAARVAAARLFEQRATTAVIAANMWLTSGALRVAPDHVAIVGFDDFFLADLLKRPVTSVAQPVEEMGMHAVRLLLEEMAKPGGARRIVLSPRLVVRGDSQ
jgi:LacI family transcriptional regulator